MKILVVSQYFWPEEFRINDICEGLVEKGHQVEVLTGLPNYPEGKIYDGYSVLKRGNKFYKNNIRVRRVPLVPRGKGPLMLALNYISYMVMGSIATIPLLFNKYDKVFVFQLSPITLAIPGIILAKIKKIPSIIYIQDLWPESLYSIKSINNKKIRSFLEKMCCRIYKSFNMLLITSKSFEDKLVKKGIDKNRIEYFPQWAEEFYKDNNVLDNEIIDQNKVDNEKSFTVTFAGNIGKAQSVLTIIEAARLCKKNENIKWQILGDGSEFENIKSLVKKYSLENTVTLLGRKPAKDMPKYFSKSDGLIVTLRNEDILKATLPAKVQSYMSAGKPIIVSASGEVNLTIKEANCGLVGEAEDYRMLYENVIKLYNMDHLQREEMILNGKRYFDNNFTRKKLLDQLDLYIKN